MNDRPPTRLPPPPLTDGAAVAVKAASMSTAWPTALRVLPVTNADTDGSTVVVADRLVPPTPMLSDAASSNRSVEIVGVDAADTMILPLLAVTCEPLTEAETPPPAVLSDVRSPIEKPKAEIVIVTWVISAVMSVVSCAVTETSRAAVTLLAPEINALVVASTSLTAVMLPVAAVIAREAGGQRHRRADRSTDDRRGITRRDADGVHSAHLLTTGGVAVLDEGFDRVRIRDSPDRVLCRHRAVAVRDEEA